jgi:hypothetical protein
MKRLIINLMSVSLFLLICSFGLQAQDTTYKMLPSITVTPATKVPSEVNKSFNQSFKDAVNPEWYKLDKKYLVTFLTTDQKNRALYKDNGQLVYHIRYGFEQNLPDDIRKMVKSNYVDFSITGAIAVSQDQRNIWVVNLEGKDKYIVVRIENGEMEEVESLKKTM